MKLPKILANTILSVALSAQTGCGFLTHYQPQDPLYQGPKPVPTHLIKHYHQTPEELPPLEKTILRESHNHPYYTKEMRSFKTYDPYLKETIELKFEYYKTKLAKKPPFVLVSPILGGSYPVERPICELLAENGISAVLARRERNFFKIEHFVPQEIAINSIVTGRKKIIDIFASSQDIDPNNMGTIGISMGAIMNVPLIALDKRLKYNILGLGGGNIPAILETSSEGRVEEFLKDCREKKGPSYCLELIKDYQSDPLAFAPSVDARNTRMFLANFDTVVRHNYGTQLHEALGKPELNTLPTGHYTTALYWFWLSDMILEFFQEKFHIDTATVEEKKKNIQQAHPIKRRVS